MVNRIAVILLGAGIGLHAAVSVGSDFKIVTATERGTYIQIGRDLEKFVARPANLDLEVLPSKGSGENVRRLRYEQGVKLAMVQSDVYQAFQDEASAGNKEAERLIRPLRVVMPLYDTEMYFVVRADSPMNYIHDIRDAKINIGPLGSGTAMSGTTLYRLMFHSAIPEANLSTLANEEALIKLVNGDKSIDVVIVAAGQPAKLFTDMKEGARNYIKLLKLDRSAPAVAAALGIYPTATLLASNYANWLTEDVPTFSVKALLVTFNYQTAENQATLQRFASSLCERYPSLREQGHPKWREVNLELPALGKGWSYYAPTAQAIRACSRQGGVDGAALKSGRFCTMQEKVLGLCGEN